MAVGGKDTGGGVEGWHAASTTAHVAISRQKRELMSERAI
jgi:hypothetical protein